MTLQGLIVKIAKEVNKLEINTNNELEKRLYDEIMDLWETTKSCYHNRNIGNKTLISDIRNTTGVLFNFTYLLSNQFGEQANKVLFHLYQLARLIEISIYG